MTPLNIFKLLDYFYTLRVKKASSAHRLRKIQVLKRFQSVEMASEWLRRRPDLKMVDF